MSPKFIFKDGFKLTDRWVISCTRHNRTMEVYLSKDSKQYCTKIIGSKAPYDYKTLPPCSGTATTVSFCGGSVTIQEAQTHRSNTARLRSDVDQTLLERGMPPTDPADPNITFWTNNEMEELVNHMSRLFPSRPT